MTQLLCLWKWGSDAGCLPPTKGWRKARLGEGGHYMGGEEEGAKEELEDRGGGKPGPELKEICE